MQMKMQTMKAILALLVLAMIAAVAVAAPYGPDTVTRIKDERYNFTDIGGKQVAAQAGNVTELTINVSVLTKRWQGYYGNISGKITLDDAYGWTLYDWTGEDMSVVGEIYAANSTITDWGSVVCVQLSGNGTVGISGPNSTQLEAAFGMNENDADGFSETFTGTQDITVGTNALTGCPATNMYVNNASQNQVFNETLLFENASTTMHLIFAAEVEQDYAGFNNQTWDFQMIVADNGDTPAPETYWFYVELT